MHFVGVDLAWGERRPTGLAVLDGDGCLLHVSAVRTDEEVVAAVSPFVAGECVVAFDAPLVVANASGNRPAEAALNRDFARFDAGAHPSNTGRQEFRDQPRGARIAGRLGLDMDPSTTSPRRAIEVYPHPATVALFRLGRTLKYKNKPGRDLALLRSELLALVEHLEGLAHASPPLLVHGRPGTGEPATAWQFLRRAVETADSKSELRVVEDQVDAVVCAYVGLLASRHPERTTTYGDFGSGYIVTPTLPADLRPTPREPGPTAQAADGSAAAVREYAALHPTVVAAADEAVRLITAVLDDAGINYLSVNGRAKSVSSFAAKAARTVDGVPAFADPLREITDQVGVRVITYALSDVRAVADLLADQVVVRDDRDMGEETASEGRFGYASRHLLVEVDDTRTRQPLPEVLRGRLVQVQIRTVLQHAWAEFEHDIRYKGTVPEEHLSDFDRRFTLAAGLLELADREFSTIRDRLRREGPGAGTTVEDDDPRISPRELAAFLAGQYPDAGWSRTDHYEWVAGLLLELGITSLTELGEKLRSADATALTERMDYRYPPGAVRRLDDALLWAYGDTYVALSGNAHRTTALRARLEKMHGAE